MPNAVHMCNVKARYTDLWLFHATADDTCNGIFQCLVNFEKVYASCSATSITEPKCNPKKVSGKNLDRNVRCIYWYRKRRPRRRYRKNTIMTQLVVIHGLRWEQFHTPAFPGFYNALAIKTWRHDDQILPGENDKKWVMQWASNLKRVSCTQAPKN